MQFENFDYPVSLTLMIFNQKLENYVDVGWDWDPIVLAKGEVMVQELVLDYIGCSIGDQVVMPVDFSSYFGDQAIMNMLALMTYQIDGMYVDFETNHIRYNFGNDAIPLSVLGIEPRDAVLNFYYTIKQTFSEPNGKFSLIFGNSAIIDCSRVFS